MKRVGIFITGSLLLSPFIICLVSDNLPLIVAGCVYLALLLWFTPKKWKMRFFIASVRFSKFLG